MSRIPDETIEQVRDSADIVAIIGEVVNLKRTGADYRGPCPFHGGTNRNFSVSPKRGSFYCFVCHEKGDVFSFLMKRAGMDYPTAVREVARRVGITVPEWSPQAAPDPREPLYEALSAAQEWYARQLLEDPRAAMARDYLGNRNIELEVAGQLGLGFAPPGGAFLDAMKTLGISESSLLESGLLFQREDGSTVPRFRSRLLFPIHDLRGRVVGFGGRILADAQPKYLNSPETPVFRKGTLLYNLQVAKNAIRKDETVIVVEGYFDAIRMTLAGFDNVVAPLGTALTPDQASLLARFAKAAVLVYDSDQPGLRATFRSGDELLRQGIRVSVVTLPPGEDPDSLVQKGGREGLAPLLSDAVDVMERKIQVLREHGWLEGVEHRRSALDKLLPTIRATKDRLTRDIYVSLVADSTGVSREAVQAEADFTPTLPPSSRQSAVVSGGNTKSEGAADPWRKLGLTAERTLLHILLAYPTWLERGRAEVKPSWFRGEEYNEIFLELTISGTELGDEFRAEKLSARAQLALRHLQNQETFVGMHVDKTYVDCCEELEARPVIELFYQQKRNLNAEKSFERKQELYSEAVRMSDDLRTEHPVPWKRHVFRKNLLIKKPRSLQSEVPPTVNAQRNVS
jgi:DNA primase